MKRTHLLPILALLVAAPLVAQTSAEKIPSVKPPAEAEKTPSGIASMVLTPSSEEVRPDANDVVAVHFIGYKSGRRMDSTYAKGTPGVFKLSEVFPAWRESILLMRYKEKRRVWIPDYLEPRGQAAVFDMELVGVKPVPNLPEDIGNQPPKGWDMLPSGAYTKILQDGSGKDYPAYDDSVVLQYTGWAIDGTVFDSTYHKERATMMPLGGVMPAFADCATQMVQGEKRLCWIPEAVAAGQWIGAPQGTLVFQLELNAVIDGAKLEESGLKQKKADG